MAEPPGRPVGGHQFEELLAQLGSAHGDEVALLRGEVNRLVGLLRRSSGPPEPGRASRGGSVSAGSDGSAPDDAPQGLATPRKLEVDVSAAKTGNTDDGPSSGGQDVDDVIDITEDENAKVEGEDSTPVSVTSPSMAKKAQRHSFGLPLPGQIRKRQERVVPVDSAFADVTPPMSGLPSLPSEIQVHQAHTAASQESAKSRQGFNQSRSLMSRFQRSLASTTESTLLMRPMATTGSSASVQPSDDSAYVWNWEHRTGWRPYSAAENERIERAYQRGDSKVRLKSGQKGTTPMEIYFVDMVQYDPITGNKRNVMRFGRQSLCMRASRHIGEIVRHLETGRPVRETFEQYQARRQAILPADIKHEEYNVAAYYHKSAPPAFGFWCAEVAQSWFFFSVTMLAVLLNSIWIGVDAEINNAESFHDADWPFLAVEYSFCVVFVVEIAIRFFAFRRKSDAMRDAWFRFDAVLVFLMLVEAIILPPILRDLREGGSNSPLELGPLFRLLKLTRLTRLARLLRAFPELLTLMKGVLAAMRSVCVTLVLLFILLYVFGILFKTQTAGVTELEQYFGSLAESMWILLIHGVFLDSPSVPLDAMRKHGGLFMTAAFLVFIFASCLTLLNMLVGILCQVAQQVSEREKDEAEQQYLKTNLLEILECYDKDNDQQIGLREFELMMKNPDVHEVLKRFGADVVGLRSLQDILFEGSSCSLSFDEILETIMRLRGGDSAHVTDVVELREYVRQRFDRLEKPEPSGTRTSSD